MDPNSPTPCPECARGRVVMEHQRLAESRTPAPPAEQVAPDSIFAMARRHG